MGYPKFTDFKDPEDISDFTVSFGQAMSDDDAISSIDRVLFAAVEPLSPAPGTDLVLEGKIHSGHIATLWLGGGRDGQQYEVGVLVRTLDGRSLQRRMLLSVKLL